MTRVLLIAANRSERDRLEDLLEAAGAEVVGSAAELQNVGDELLEATEVVLVAAAAEPLEQILEELQAYGLLTDSRVVLLSNARSSASMNQALRAGVRGVLPSVLSATQLASALDAVSRDLIVLHPDENQFERAGVDSMEFVEPLTTREREVLQMLAQGRGNKDIAARLNISEHTVKFHVASILGKLGASTRTEAVSLALRRGLILF